MIGVAGHCLTAFFHRSSSVDDSAKPVATARTEFCSFSFLRLPEDDEFLLCSSASILASILVCIALSAFAFSLILSSTRANRALFFLSHRRQGGAKCCCDFVVTMFYQSHDRIVILLCILFCQAFLFSPCLFVESLDYGVQVDSCF